jgi:hypothetical protein
MADVTITVSGGALNESTTIPDAVVSRLNDMIEAYYAGFLGDGDFNLAEKLLAGIKDHLKRDTFDFERDQARLRMSGWTPPDLG